MNKLHRKDFSIAVKKGTDANKSKFAKEAVQGEMYYATDSRSLYIANTTAGAIDSVLTRYDFTHPFNIDSDTEANILASSPTAPSGYATKMFGSDTGNFYIYDGAWYIYNKEPFSKYSVSFDGSNDYLALTETDLTSAMSFSAWVNLSSTSVSKAPIIADDNQESFWYLNPANGYLYLKDLAGNSMYTRSAWSGTFATNTWYHLMLTYDGSGSLNSTSAYINGILVNTFTGNGVAGFRYDLIGKQGSGSHFPGKIDEVAIWGSDQTSNVSAIYNNGGPADISSFNPVGWWRMGDNDGGAGTTITDQGSGGNNGTLVNGPTFSTDTLG